MAVIAIPFFVISQISEPKQPGFQLSNGEAADSIECATEDSDSHCKQESQFLANR